MSLLHLQRRFRYGFHRSRLLQISLLVGLWLLGQELVKLTGLPVTGGIAGMVVLLVLLASRFINIKSLRMGANWFLAEMLLFFVPAVLAVLDHHELLGLLGLKVLVVIFGSTLTVFGVTALVIDLFVRLRARKNDSAS
ncbi:CidA/LrgA family protein [Gallaecimonas mangrovi]|uniref:CidA/LrgA family protein n=1 Tax=Gallaecimonas mangrovi TaxID=2291597 RepID=UPI000E2006C4|nr:CidA/LrgA family protein [Gallaecimonas mangrovi]